MSSHTESSTDSPFHKGEQLLQAKLGIRKEMESIGKRVIRSYMPDQHRQFYQQLPFVFAGHADAQGQAWASILFGDNHFIQSPTTTTLNINATPIVGDPFNLVKAGDKLGLLGIELHTRRRNRLSVQVISKDKQNLELQVLQSFGNCPQYIQNRSLTFKDKHAQVTSNPEKLTQLDEHAISLIKHADTFFVASYFQDENNSDLASNGADVSHRGGMPGFIRIDDNKTLIIPDYTGNNSFNTLGNFTHNAKAGLLFIDFIKGEILTLTGEAKILWNHPDTLLFTGAERLWEFKLDHGFWLRNALPFTWKFDGFSANTLLTGSWDKTQEEKQEKNNTNQWLEYKITRIVSENNTIKSFYLSSKDHNLNDFKPGQFLTIKTDIEQKEYIRNYTLSNTPRDTHYRISVKLEESTSYSDGIVSSYFHKHMKVGDSIYAKRPQGEFILSENAGIHSIFAAGGIGITPMISMLRHAAAEVIEPKKARKISLIFSVKNSKQCIFYDELQNIVDKSKGHIRIYWIFSQPTDTDKKNRRFHHEGRLSKSFLQETFPLDDYEIYLCGPTGFMQDNYTLFRKLGINDEKIYAETFGPAALIRDEIKADQEQSNTAKSAIVTFNSSKFEQPWVEKDGNLLEFAEAHGLTPEYGCRNGQCGACKTTLLSGKVNYETPLTIELKSDEILICCAKPAQDKNKIDTKICLDM